MFYSWYITPRQISKMSSNCDDKYWKGCKNAGTFFHMWWSCPKVLKFWGEIYKVIQDILNVKYDFGPKYFLLSVRPSNLPNSMNFFYVTTAARLLLASKWRQQTIPGIEDWLDKMRNYAIISRSPGT